MRRIILAAIVAISVFQNSNAQCVMPVDTQVSIGANINGLSDWNRDRPFNDVFKMNRGMSKNTNAPWNYVAPLMDSKGWPLEDFGVIVMVDMDSTMGGKYKIRFNGQATITPVASGFTVSNQVYNSATNTTNANLIYPNAIVNGSQMMIKFTNTLYAPGVGGVKNIKIMQPGIAFNGPVFSQRFLNHLSRFRVLRFMDWHSTNASPDSLWMNRTLKTSTTQATDRGVAWEYCCELANALNKDIWINVPHKVNNYYITQLASLIKNKLNSSLNVYVEYSNEVWNWSFAQSNWNLNQSIIDANKPGSPLNYDNVNDNYTWCQRRYAQRTKDISDIFKSTFGATAINNRVRVVYGVQFGWFDFTKRGLEFINNYYGAPSNYFYAVTIAPYFNTSSIDTGNVATKQDVLNSLQNSVYQLFDSTDNSVDVWAAEAKFFRMKLICYEGGPDTFGPNNIQSKKDASKDVQMKFICTDYLNKWFAYETDGLFNWFTAGAGSWDSQYGTWSLTEHFENSYKLQAIDSVISQTPPLLTAGHSIPGNIDARKIAGYSTNWNSSIDFLPAGWVDFYQYLLRVPVGQSGDYSLQIETKSNSNNQQLHLWVDNMDYGLVSIQNNNNIGYVTTASISIPDLSEGLHALRFKPVTSSYHIRNFVFSLAGPCNPLPRMATGDDLKINVFPNPADDALNIVLTDLENASVKIFNSIGEMVFSETILQKDFVINTSQFDPGIYLLELTMHGKIQKSKFVVMH